jgi:hypothetical protein
MGRVRNAYRILSETLKGRDSFKKVNVDGRIILK